MLLLAGIATEAISYWVGAPGAPVWWVAAFGVLVLVLFLARGMYSTRLGSHLLDDFRSIVSATAVATMAVITLRVMLTDDVHTSAQTAQTWIVAAFALSAGRTGLSIARARAISRGDGGRRTLIVGAGKVGHLVARRLRERPQYGLRPVGYLDHEPLTIEGETEELPVLGASWDLEKVIEDHNVEHVVFTFSTAPHAVMLGMVRRCRELGLSASLVPRLFEVSVDRVSVEHLGGLPLLEMRAINPKGWQFLVKYAIDRVLAGDRDPADLADPDHAHGGGVDHLGAPDLLPPAPHRPRRPGVQHAQVPHDARQSRGLRPQPRELGVRHARRQRLAARGRAGQRQRPRGRQRPRATATATAATATATATPAATAS